MAADNVPRCGMSARTPDFRPNAVRKITIVTHDDPRYMTPRLSVGRTSVCMPRNTPNGIPMIPPATTPTAIAHGEIGSSRCVVDRPPRDADENERPHPHARHAGFSAAGRTAPPIDSDDDHEGQELRPPRNARVTAPCFAASQRDAGKSGAALAT